MHVPVSGRAVYKCIRLQPDKADLQLQESSHHCVAWTTPLIVQTLLKKDPYSSEAKVLTVSGSAVTCSIQMHAPAARQG